mgnify:CR=1 FL=1
MNLRPTVLSGILVCYWGCVNCCDGIVGFTQPDCQVPHEEGLSSWSVLVSTMRVLPQMGQGIR